MNSKLKKKRWVIKAGSQMVCGGGVLLMRHWMHQVAQLCKQDIEVIWVTSGAIAWAVERTNFKEKKRTLEQKQALSAIGQPLVMDLYNLALHANGLLGSQVLLTAGDMRDQVRRKNLQNTLRQLLRWNVIPILNENDAVSPAEIRFGDNDTLSSMIAQMMKSEKLILLTDVDGLYDTDPKKNPKAQLIPHCPSVTAKQLQVVKNASPSQVGTGGMYSKLLAAQRAQRSGIVTHLVRGDYPNQLLEIAAGRSLGTQIHGPFTSSFDRRRPR